MRIVGIKVIEGGMVVRRREKRQPDYASGQEVGILALLDGAGRIAPCMAQVEMIGARSTVLTDTARINYVLFGISAYVLPHSLRMST